MSLEFIVFFAFLSFFTSLLTSIFSVGGGLIMLVALAQSFSPATLIPLHGSIQLANNFSRTLVYREFVQCQLIKHIVISSMFGALVGIFLFGTLSENLLLILIAITILFLTWAPIDNFILSVMKNDWFCGLISGFVGIFVGANGPLVTAYLRTKNLSPEVLVANHGAIMIFQHAIKIPLFTSFFSFSMKGYFLFILILAFTGYAGANLGRRLISIISFDSFNIALKILLTFLSIFLII
ncbi:sulfite exporter TauE/SafE family protein [Gammaproteobacteria bacterium]|nr:sulfite exporter TauE/SafE family protein [Gammaproteobacteria bacterium]MDC3381022.1 sulfite exporter TauE/SafE family protein [Gammaproteobacteria bacterium]